MEKEFWILALCLASGKRKPEAKVLSSAYIPALGERQQIISIGSKADMEKLFEREQADLSRHWGQLYQLEYQDGLVKLIGQNRMAELIQKFVGDKRK